MFSSQEVAALKEFKELTEISLEQGISYYKKNNLEEFKIFLTAAKQSYVNPIYYTYFILDLAIIIENIGGKSDFVRKEILSTIQFQPPEIYFYLISECAQTEDSETLKKLLEVTPISVCAGGSPSCTPLYRFAVLGKMEQVYFLLKHGGSICEALSGLMKADRYAEINKMLLTIPDVENDDELGNILRALLQIHNKIKKINSLLNKRKILRDDPFTKLIFKSDVAYKIKNEHVFFDFLDNIFFRPLLFLVKRSLKKLPDKLREKRIISEFCYPRRFLINREDYLFSVIEPYLLSLDRSNPKVASIIKAYKTHIKEQITKGVISLDELYARKIPLKLIHLANIAICFLRAGNLHTTSKIFESDPSVLPIVKNLISEVFISYLKLPSINIPRLVELMSYLQFYYHFNQDLGRLEQQIKSRFLVLIRHKQISSSYLDLVRDNMMKVGIDLFPPKKVLVEVSPKENFLETKATPDNVILEQEEVKIVPRILEKKEKLQHLQLTLADEIKKSVTFPERFIKLKDQELIKKMKHFLSLGLITDETLKLKKYFELREIEENYQNIIKEIKNVLSEFSILSLSVTNSIVAEEDHAKKIKESEEKESLKTISPESKKDRDRKEWKMTKEKIKTDTVSDKPILFSEKTKFFSSLISHACQQSLATLFELLKENEDTAYYFIENHMAREFRNFFQLDKNALLSQNFKEWIALTGEFYQGFKIHNLALPNNKLFKKVKNLTPWEDALSEVKYCEKMLERYKNYPPSLLKERAIQFIYGRGGKACSKLDSSKDNAYYLKIFDRGVANDIRHFTLKETGVKEQRREAIHEAIHDLYKVLLEMDALIPGLHASLDKLSR